jgi:integrase
MIRVNITRREMKRRLRNGRVKTLLRYIVNFHDPRTGQRVQKFFDKQKDAVAEQGKLIEALRAGSYADAREVPTIAEAFDYWLNDRSGHIKSQTLFTYKKHQPYIVGPLLLHNERRLTDGERGQYGRRKIMPEGSYLREMLGSIKVSELTTAQIRSWHKVIADGVSDYTANRSRQHLKTLMDVIAEDFNIRPPVMPRRKGRGKPRVKKPILTPEEAGRLLAYAETDKDYGVFVAFPFLTGVRPSEQLGLLWDDVDLEKRTIRICRMQEKDGRLCDFTKTIAGNRSIPINSLLHKMLMEWKERCPFIEGQPRRVFPNIGFHRYDDEPRNGGGGCLIYTNFRRRVWNMLLEKAGVPIVPPHSARKFFISNLQALGVEVGLAAKLAGHSNATVTLSYYTLAVRGGEEAVEALAKVFQAPAANPPATVVPAS